MANDNFLVIMPHFAGHQRNEVITRAQVAEGMPVEAALDRGYVIPTTMQAGTKASTAALPSAEMIAEYEAMRQRLYALEAEHGKLKEVHAGLITEKHSFDKLLEEAQAQNAGLQQRIAQLEAGQGKPNVTPVS